MPNITFNLSVKRWYFVTKQDCKTCGKSTTHVPENCLELPQNAEAKKRKEDWMARRAGKNN